MPMLSFSNHAKRVRSFFCETALGRRVLVAVKAVWVAAVLAVAVWYVGREWEQLRAYAMDLGITALLLSLGFLTAGRLLLAAISKESMRIVGEEIGLLDSFYVNSLSQLGKYIPGSMWHLVGRVTIYRKLGISSARGSAVLAIENVVLLACGACVGIVLTLEGIVDVLGPVVQWRVVTVTVALALALIVWWLMVEGIGRRIADRFGGESGLCCGRLFWLGPTFWLAFGLAFWFVFGSDARTLGVLPAAIGSFALAWIAGYVSPFAPAGIGVRESVIVAVLGPVIGLPSAVGAAAASRVVWTIQELAMAPFAAWRLGKRSTALGAEPRSS